MARKRKNGEGSVILRKDGRWEGRYVIGYDEKGYPKTKNVLAKAKKECVEKLKVLKEQYGGLKSEKIAPDMPFGDWIEFWYQNYSKPNLRPTTRASYEGRIYKHIIPEIGKIPLNQLTQNDLQQFYVRQKNGGRMSHVELNGKGLSNAMVRGMHANCRAALEKAVQEKLIRVNPAIGCKLPPKKAREMQVLTREEMQRFLIQTKEEGYYEIFLLELATGLRRGELVALQWDDLNFETGELKISRQVYQVKGELTISTPKTKASIRSLILPPPLLVVLKEYRETVDSRWMFPSPVMEDLPIGPDTIRARMQDVLERAQCKHVRFHDLRHTFSTEALSQGMDVKTLSAILGHTSAATTLDIYTHLTNSMQVEAASKIDRKIEKNTDAQIPTEVPREAPKEKFVPFIPYRRRTRKSGTGCITKLSETRWEGRYSPKWSDGKKHSRNVYAKTREECEEKLKVLIKEMKAEIKAIEEGGTLVGIPDGISEKKRQVMVYMRQHPEVTNKSKIAREIGVDRSTLQRHYDDIRREIRR